MLFGGEEVVQGAQDLRELLSGQLGRSAGARAEAREFDNFFAGQVYILHQEVGRRFARTPVYRAFGTMPTLRLRLRICLKNSRKYAPQDISEVSLCVLCASA